MELINKRWQKIWRAALIICPTDLSDIHTRIVKYAVVHNKKKKNLFKKRAFVFLHPCPSFYPFIHPSVRASGHLSIYRPFLSTFLKSGAFTKIKELNTVQAAAVFVGLLVGFFTTSANFLRSILSRNLTLDSILNTLINHLSHKTKINAICRNR